MKLKKKSTISVFAAYTWVVQYSLYKRLEELSIEKDEERNGVQRLKFTNDEYILILYLKNWNQRNNSLSSTYSFKDY